MIPKELIIFVSIGVIAGAIFGLISIDFKNTDQLEFVEGSSLSIVTEKIDFKKGEEIEIRIINSGTIPLTFLDATYGVRIAQLDNIEIYSPTAAQVISILEPKEEVSFVWDQIKNDGSDTLYGTYKIISKTTDEHQNEVKKSIIINIFK